MRTLHVGLRVKNLDRSLAFYRGVGYEVVGRVPETPLGELVMLSCPTTTSSASSLRTIHRAPTPTAPADRAIS